MYIAMLREWASKETAEKIEQALRAPAGWRDPETGLPAGWDDDDEWSAWERASR